MSIAKRLIDVALAALAMVVFSPLLLSIGAAIYLTDGGAVFFRQTRIGFGGQRFKIVKFRSMVRDAEARLHSDPVLRQVYFDNDHKVPEELETRITRIGRFLRKTSLDELPQLWNVLTGEMTMVGPRPVVPSELEEYGEHAADYASTRPGLTGPWQASGRSTLSYAERVALDVHYVRNWSLWTDIKIILLTIPAVLRRHGAH